MERSPSSQEPLLNPLMERIHNPLPGGDAPPQWGSPLLSTTPTPHAIAQLARQVEALEKAVREISLEVQKLSADE